jgi:N-acetylneuraminate synthase/N,N'-diacetyllegionaminate synthase
MKASDFGCNGLSTYIIITVTMFVDVSELTRQVLVVAEIGNNHEGSFSLAEELIQTAAIAGVQAVKFQTFIPEHLVSRSETDRLARLRKFSLSFYQFNKLAGLAKQLGLLFFSTPFDLSSAEALNQFCPIFKIASGDNTFLPLIEKVASFKKPILISTGLASLSDLERTHGTIRRIWEESGYDGEIVLLHCVASYPAPPQEANLLAIRTLAQKFGCAVGYSDHTLGIDAAVLSVALGARIIEKHFTLNKQQSDYRDHQLSADPAEMAELVKRVKDAEILLGDGRKKLQASEEANRTAFRRSIAASCDLSAGTILRLEHLTWVRPGGGLSPGREATLLGRTVQRSILKGDILQLEDFV